MNGTKAVKIFLLAIYGIFIFVSCENKDNENLIESTRDEVRFDIVLPTRDDSQMENLNDNTLENINEFFSDGESCVYLSHRATNLDTDFTPGSSNCYKYVYSKNDEATWESGFNFNPVTAALDWGKILDNGQDGQGFAFALLFFPRGNNADYKYEVGADQNKVDDFYEWDILGAFHRTSIIRDRLRFQLKHLLCRIKINLYVPVIDTELANGYNVTDISATALAFHREYAVKFDGNWDSESIPVAQTFADSSTEAIIENIQMKKSDETPQGSEVILENLSDFSIGDMETDRVRKFSFEMIFPPQTKTGDLFQLTLWIDGNETNYLFNSSNLTKNEGNLIFQGGYVTNLELYLPRTDNKIVLFRANILDWNKASSEFIIMPDDDIKNNGEE